MRDLSTLIDTAIRRFEIHECENSGRAGVIVRVLGELVLDTGNRGEYGRYKYRRSIGSKNDPISRGISRSSIVCKSSINLITYLVVM